MGATMLLKDGYPCLELLVNLPEPIRKLLTAYETVSETNDNDGVQRAECVWQKNVQQSVSSNKLSFLFVKVDVYWISNTFMVVLKIFLN